jgi:ABC-type lipoprotein export system ATPase subunit
VSSEVRHTMICLDRVTKTFDRPQRTSQGVRAVRDVSLSIAPGEFVALMGPSGCGKSTLLGLVAGIDRPSVGKVWVAGECVSSLSERDLVRYRREVVGVVYQFFHLLPTLTAVENVALPLILNGHAQGEAFRRAADMLDRVGLSDRTEHLPSELSGGELQRVALGRAVVHRPKLVLADEPTGNLDSAMGEDLMAHLRSLADENGLTVLLATHSHEIATLADRIVTMHDGSLQDAPSRPIPSD